jgi:hypothetical protein
MVFNATFNNSSVISWQLFKRHQATVKAQMTASLPYGSYTVLEYSSSIKTVFDFNYFLTVV